MSRNFRIKQPHTIDFSRRAVENQLQSTLAYHTPCLNVCKQVRIPLQSIFLLLVYS